MFVNQTLFKIDCYRHLICSDTGCVPFLLHNLSRYLSHHFIILLEQLLFLACNRTFLQQQYVAAVFRLSSNDPRNPI